MQRRHGAGDRTPDGPLSPGLAPTGINRKHDGRDRLAQRFVLAFVLEQRPRRCFGGREGRRKRDWVGPCRGRIALIRSRPRRHRGPTLADPRNARTGSLRNPATGAHHQINLPSLPFFLCQSDGATASPTGAIARSTRTSHSPPALFGPSSISWGDRVDPVHGVSGQSTWGPGPRTGTSVDRSAPPEGALDTLVPPGAPARRRRLGEAPTAAVSCARARYAQ